jgi:peptidoglycan/LPS O-acetylase OafA/YrhL
MNYRLKELDFLRGIAIILVLLRHIPLLGLVTNMGWIGVDLFFVLSGFLVSGLLFKEYLKFDDLKPKLFLIRRGFKIYPIYYIFYIPYLALIILKGHFDFRGFMSDMTFTQNYFWGWGYAYQASWSLAVEEHFYFGLTFFLWLLLKRKPTFIHKKGFVITIVSMLVLCLVLRLAANFIFETDSVRLFTMTQFRIDSLLSGVLVSHFYHFRNEQLNAFF